MPIRPENKGFYPANWKSEIVPMVRARSGNQCEQCGVKNLAMIVRAKGRNWYRYVVSLDTFTLGAVTYSTDSGEEVGGNTTANWHNPIKVILTVAHLDHDPRNNDPANLRHLCQLHHNQHDAAHRAESRKNNRGK